MDEFDIHIFLTPEDETDFFIEIIGAAVELMRSGRIEEARFYLECALPKEIEYDEIPH